MQHQFNLGSAVQPPVFIPKKDPAAPMYASVEGVAMPLSDEEVVFQTRGRDEAQVLTTQVLLTLDHCRPFRSMDEHIAEVIRKVPGLNNHDRVRQGLEMLARVGLLVSDADLLEHSRGHNLEPAPVAGLCVRACDRPDNVRRLLASLERNEQRHGTGIRVILLDDSRTAEAARQHVAMLHDYAEATGSPVSYIGGAEQERLAEKLRAALPEHGAAIDSLLERSRNGFSGGRAWNLALLLTAGRRFFMLDDDNLLPLRMHPDWKPGLALRPGMHETMWFHGDQAEALAAGTEVEGDPFALHLDLTGRALGDVASAGLWEASREAVRGLTMADLRGLYDGYRVLASCNGTRGSSRMANSQAFLLLDAEGRRRLCSSREDYLRNLAATNLWHGTQRAHPAPQSFMTPFALDNSVMLPCTRATGRNEDALFSTLVRFCHPNSVAVFLPTTIGHVQEAGREQDKVRAGASPWRVNVNTFAYETLHNHLDRCISDDPVQRLQFASDIFADIAGANEHRRIVHLREYLNYERADMIAQLQQQLVSAKDAPVYWQADVRALIEANAKAMADNKPPRLSDWAADLDASACSAALRDSMHELADSLRAWPDMWAWAADEGERLLESL